MNDQFKEKEYNLLFVDSLNSTNRMTKNLFYWLQNQGFLVKTPYECLRDESYFKINIDLKTFEIIKPVKLKKYYSKVTIKDSHDLGLVIEYISGNQNDLLSKIESEYLFWIVDKNFQENYLGLIKNLPKYIYSEESLILSELRGKNKVEAIISYEILPEDKIDFEKSIRILNKLNSDIKNVSFILIKKEDRDKILSIIDYGRFCYVNLDTKEIVKYESVF